MTAIVISERNIREFKSALHEFFDEVPSSHMSEAVAAAMGFRTHASLLHTLKRKVDSFPDAVLLDDGAFFSRLDSLGWNLYSDDWLGFWELQANCLIGTDPIREAENNYDSERKQAWRNIMVSAINAGIDQRLFSVLPQGNFWPGYRDDGMHHSFRYSFTVGDIPGAAVVNDIGYDELSIHAALWPTGKGLMVFEPDFDSGEAAASGWLERNRGAWLQFDPAWLRCRRSKLSTVAELVVKPQGFGDRGRFIF